MHFPLFSYSVDTSLACSYFQCSPWGVTGPWAWVMLCSSAPCPSDCKGWDLMNGAVVGLTIGVMLITLIVHDFYPKMFTTASFDLPWWAVKGIFPEECVKQVMTSFVSAGALAVMLMGRWHCQYCSHFCLIPATSTIPEAFSQCLVKIICLREKVFVLFFCPRSRVKLSYIWVSET